MVGSAEAKPNEAAEDIGEGEQEDPGSPVEREQLRFGGAGEVGEAVGVEGQQRQRYEHPMSVTACLLPAAAVLKCARRGPERRGTDCLEDWREPRRARQGQRRQGREDHRWRAPLLLHAISPLRRECGGGHLGRDSGALESFTPGRGRHPSGGGGQHRTHRRGSTRRIFGSRCVGRATRRAVAKSIEITGQRGYTTGTEDEDRCGAHLGHMTTADAVRRRQVLEAIRPGQRSLPAHRCR